MRGVSRSPLRWVSRVTDAATLHGGIRALRRGVDPRRLRLYKEVESFFGLSIRTVLYIGANVGQDLDLLRAAFPTAEIHCFEPQSRPFLELMEKARRDTRVESHKVALADRPGLTELWCSSDHHEASSLRKPGKEMQVVFPHVGGWSREIVEVARLDDWVRGSPLADDIFVKLDVQGAEDLVIEGGPETFRRAAAVVAEAAVRPTYEGAPDMSELLARFGRLGYKYGGQFDVVRSEQTAEVVEFDALFVRVAESDRRRPAP